MILNVFGILAALIVLVVCSMSYAGKISKKHDNLVFATGYISILILMFVAICKYL